jgi:hypothetical protein
MKRAPRAGVEPTTFRSRGGRNLPVVLSGNVFLKISQIIETISVSTAVTERIELSTSGHDASVLFQ